MQSGETPPSNNSEINPTAGNENPWSKMAEELSGEIARRNPDYFGQDEMQAILNSEIKASEQRVEQFMVDGYVGEDGFIRMAPNGEKVPSAATEDAEIDLKYAKQDAETFALLMNDYQAANDYAAPRAIKKENFAPTIDKFIDDHTAQLNQLMAESKTLTKGTPEYAENEAKRKQLVKERSSARRLNARFFNVPRAETPVGATTPETPASEAGGSDDDGMSMEQMPTGKTKEQIEAEKSKKRQEQYEETQRRMRESWEQKRQAEQRQREENERQQQARQKAEEERQRRIREERERVINAQRQASANKVNEEELEEENEMSM